MAKSLSFLMFAFFLVILIPASEAVLINSDEMPMKAQEDLARLEFLQNSLLNATEAAYQQQLPIVTLDTSLTEIKKQRPVDVTSFSLIFSRMRADFKLQNCSMDFAESFPTRIYMERIHSPSSPSGDLRFVEDLLPIVNTLIDCQGKSFAK